jgi:predicted metalloprotease with PDZ domain
VSADGPACPFDYDKPNLTNMLWFSEGFTVYYEFLMLARAGLMTQEELLEALGKSIASYENNTGRLFQSATQSSYETWGQEPFSRRGDGISKTISYYEKGPVLGWLLDLRIRHETQNKRSLDDVMRTLYREFYKQKQRGFTDQEFRAVCEKIAGAPLTEIYEYASTTKEIDYPKYLSYAGLELEQPKELLAPWLGELVEDKGNDLIIAAVENNSPARQADLESQEIIRLLNGTKVNAKQWDQAFTALKPGHTIRLIIASGGADREVTIPLGHKMAQSYRMKTTMNPAPLQAKILQGLMRQE